MLLMICLWCVRHYKHIESVQHSLPICIFHLVFTAALRWWHYYVHNHLQPRGLNVRESKFTTQEFTGYKWQS